MRPQEYFKKMQEDGRLISISHLGKTHCFLTFSICKDYKPYQHKSLWDFLPHDETGNICYVETMVARNWTPGLRRQLEAAIIERYPQVVSAVWHRPGEEKDREIIYNRRIKHEASV